jgi:hypothetical protein
MDRMYLKDLGLINSEKRKRKLGSNLLMVSLLKKYSRKFLKPSTGTWLSKKTKSYLTQKVSIITRQTYFRRVSILWNCTRKQSRFWGIRGKYLPSLSKMLTDLIFWYRLSVHSKFIDINSKKGFALSNSSWCWMSSKEFLPA